MKATLEPTEQEVGELVYEALKARGHKPVSLRFKTRTVEKLDYLDKVVAVESEFLGAIIEIEIEDKK